VSSTSAVAPTTCISSASARARQPAGTTTLIRAAAPRRTTWPGPASSPSRSASCGSRAPAENSDICPIAETVRSLRHGGGLHGRLVGAAEADLAALADHDGADDQTQRDDPDDDPHRGVLMGAVYAVLHN